MNVVQFPDPLLKKASLPVTVFDSALETFIKDFTKTLYSHTFCVGLAAVQVGNLQRVIAIDISQARKPHPNNGFLILINPVISEASDFKIVREGCLSIPDYTANVKRAMDISIAYQNTKGETKTLSTKDFEAHVIQHEMDHLDGILFLDRITNPASDLFRRVRH